MRSRKVVLAYSGGLDTSVIAKWLMEEHDLEVVTFTADIGQGEETRDARVKAKKLGIKKIYIEDLREDFVKNYVYPMFRANAIYEGEYFLGTSIARPLISKRLIEIAKKANIKRTVYASSVAALGLPPNGPWKETLYGAYKLANEHTAFVYWSDWQVPSIGIRPNIVLA